MWNEARGDYFFYPNVTLWDHFFALAQQSIPHTKFGCEHADRGTDIDRWDHFYYHDGECILT